MAVQNAKNGVVWGGLGHSKSWAMPLFDRAHTTSCLTLIVTMRLSCTVFEQYRTVWRERFGAAVGTLKMRDMKLRDMKMRHHVAGVENARHEFAAPDCKGVKCET